MNVQTAGHDAHLADDELLRFIDGEADPEQPRWDEHLRGCEHCTREVQLLCSDALVVRQWLTRAAFEEEALPVRGARTTESRYTRARSADVVPIASAGQRRRRRTRIAPWMRAAAVLVLLASPVAAVPALRQWIVGTITDLRGPADVPAAAQHELRSAAEAGPIRFIPVSGTFQVQIDRRQASGSITIEYGPGAEAVLQMSGGDGVEPVVSAAALRLRNTPASSASYSLLVPSGVRHVTVQVADGRAVGIDAAGLRQGTTVNLQQ